MWASGTSYVVTVAFSASYVVRKAFDAVLRDVSASDLVSIQLLNLITQCC